MTYRDVPEAEAAANCSPTDNPRERTALDATERLLALLDAVHDTAAEVRARCAEYFDHQPLRLRRTTLARCAPDPDALAARIGAGYRLTVRTVDDEAELTTVDRLAEHRAAGAGHTRADELGADARHDGAALVDAVRRSRDEADRRLREEAERCAQEPPRRVGVLGGVLAYRVAGEPDPHRPPVVVLNALGMGLGPWHRLTALLARRHRMISWSPRGCGPRERPLRLADQVADLRAVLSAEGVSDCHLLAWCTGPKVALEFHRRDPGAVRSMVLLNGSFRLLDRPDDPDTAYERNLEAMCRAVTARPVLADVMRRMLGGELGERPDFTAEPDPGRWAEQVLALPAEDLAEDLRRPFADGPTLLAYARQLLDFWSRDPLAHAERVTVPVLAVTGELDRIAAPDRLARDIGRFPAGQHVRLPGATHHALHDRPHELAALLTEFLDRAGPRAD
ncbi:alpha/beta fold hydrolase [Kitasatospora griseola]|uniref:alpha/beta fold hydrolase n=1 Tax=Kitasatospora griseola TaxID=2064 RepID=UPI0036DE011B